MNNEVVAFFANMGVDVVSAPYIYWIAVVLIVLLAIYGSRFFCRKIFMPLVATLVRQTQTMWDDLLLNDGVLKNICDLMPPIILVLFLPYMFADESLLRIFASKLCWVYIIVVSVKLLCSLLSSLYVISSQHEKLKNRALQGVFQMLKIVVICLGVIVVISELVDKNPMRVIAGFGASAAILMLVFKDTIMGLVAGVQLSANDMLRPGDWISMPKFGADGEVIEVTLTTVKVQNWDKTITTIPPYLLVSDSFQNWRGMRECGGRRVKRSVYIDMRSIAFCSEKQLEAFAAAGWLQGVEGDERALVNLYVFRKYLENYLRNHPRVNNNLIFMVRQLQPTPQGLPLELYFFSDGTDWIPYENLQSEVFEHLFAVLPQFGLRVFQSPAGTDFSDEDDGGAEYVAALPPKKRQPRRKKHVPDNSNTLF